MRIVFAIFSHSNTAQVIRLISTLRKLAPQHEIVVHHDPRNGAIDSNAVELAGGRVVPNPVRGEWGDYSLVEQHLHTMRWCIDNLEFDWYLNLTGQTYPIRPIRELEERLAVGQSDAWLDWFDAYDLKIWPGDEAYHRYHYRYVKLPRFLYWHRLPKRTFSRFLRLIEKANTAQRLFHFFRLPLRLPMRLGLRTTKRPFSAEGRRLLAANLNMNLNRKAVVRVVEIASADPNYCEYFRHTVIPDEVFFATLLCNAADLRVGRGNLRFICWPSAHAASGGVLTMDDLAALETADAYFALKVDEHASAELMDSLDQKLGLSSSV